MPRKTICTDIDRRTLRTKNNQEPFVPTEKQREYVALQSAYGTSQEKIAASKPFRNWKYPQGISLGTLVKHFRTEIDRGVEIANAELGGALFLEAKKGNIRAIDSWFDRRGGAAWRRRTGQEVTGANGGPIQYHELSDEELDAKLKALTTGTDDSSAHSSAED